MEFSMKTLIERDDYRVPIRSWLPEDEIEPAAMAQLENAARHPEAAEAVAVMPDCHVGYGVTIGCVFPTRDAVVPNAVGVDIGCGVCAVNTGLRYDRERMPKAFWRSVGWPGQSIRAVRVRRAPAAPGARPA